LPFPTHTHTLFCDCHLHSCHYLLLISLHYAPLILFFVSTNVFPISTFYTYKSYVFHLYSMFPSSLCFRCKSVIYSLFFVVHRIFSILHFLAIFILKLFILFYFHFSCPVSLFLLILSFYPFPLIQIFILITLLLLLLLLLLFYHHHHHHSLHSMLFYTHIFLVLHSLCQV
jgi:hypothetical protein